MVNDKTIKIYCPDIECDSCIKLIDRKLSKLNGVKKLSAKKDSIDVEFDSKKISSDKLISIIQDNGFRASLEPFSRKSFSERWRDFTENKEKYQTEYTMLAYSLYALLLLFALQTVGYYSFFKQNPELVSKYAWWIFYLDISIVSIGSALWHLKSYRMNVTSMTGMMIGMTFGMQTGMMIGIILGATNGMLVGATVGMLISFAIGAYTAKSSGIMGVLQGMMSGMMGGIMGAMTGVMLIIDNILTFMPLYIILNVIIMMGFSYLLYEEAIEDNPKAKREQINFWAYLAYCIIAVAILSALIIYGPKTGFAAVVA